MISFCLSLDPNIQKFSRIRNKAIAALFKLGSQFEGKNDDVEDNFLLKMAKNLLGD